MHFFFRDIHGYVLWYRKGYFSKPTPQAKPRSVSLDIRQLSLEQQSPPLPLRPRYNAYVYLKWRCYYQNVTCLLLEVYIVKNYSDVTLLQQSVLSWRRFILVVDILFVYLIYFCSNPPPPQLPPSRLSHRRHTLQTKDELDKPADGSIHGITGTTGLSSHKGLLIYASHRRDPLT